MTIAYIHPVIGVAFLMVWALAGRIAIERR